MAQAALLPERHTTSDFFIADIFDALPVKNDRHSMEHPFFTLSTKKDLRTIKYSKNGVSIKVKPDHEHGLPTMFDKDILLYCGSLVVAEFNKHPTKWPPQTLRFSCHDLMVTTNRMTNGQAYAQLKNAFERLNGCTITTNIETNGKKAVKGFHLIEHFEVIESSHNKSRMVRVEVKLSDWYYNALVGKEVLTINRDYFRLRKPLERRLYELARKHCGHQEHWFISLEKLKDKCGSIAELRKFRAHIKRIIAIHQSETHFPDYDIALSDKDIVTFTNRKKDPFANYPRISEEAQELLQTLKPATLDKAYSIVDRARTGWDFNVIVEQFAQFITKKGAPDNVNAAFIGFVKTKSKQTPS